MSNNYQNHCLIKVPSPLNPHTLTPILNRQPLWLSSERAGDRTIVK
ncbi:hypothetical protein [Nostoc sp. FACHB-190]|nr:hypothetical protein [Nostoc sp. FACHB-190]